jgi:hypothetical protein
MNAVDMAYEDLMDSRVPVHRIAQKLFYPRFIGDMDLVNVILDAGPENRTDEQFEDAIRRIIGWMAYLGRHDKKKELRPKFAQGAVELQALLDRWTQMMAARNGGMWGPGFRRP